MKDEEVGVAGVGDACDKKRVVMICNETCIYAYIQVSVLVLTGVGDACDKKRRV